MKKGFILIPQSIKGRLDIYKYQTATMKRVIDKGKHLIGLQHNPSTAEATLADSLSLSLSLCLQPPNKRLNNKEQIELLLG